VISVWSKIRSRRTRISWDELQTRVVQEMGKRLELAAYRAGFSPNARFPSEVLRTDRGAFFFSTEELPALSGLLKENAPEEVAEIVRGADEVCRHRFHLLGYDSLDYGPEIDWHLDAAHGKRAPFKPWFKIPILDFSTVGDHKVTWELNRHQHLVTLAKAWVVTREEKYVAELVSQWYSWQVANSFPMGMNWASSLEVSFRSLSWLWVYFLLAECPVVPAGFRLDLCRALALHARYIERYLSTYFSPNTHLLGEAAGLFFIGTLFPQIPGASRWQNRGWRILLSESQRQVHSDGVYFEQTLYYHVYALDLLLHARILAARNRMAIPAVLDATLERMLRVLVSVSQAGPPESFGDDDGGRVFNPRRNRTEHLTDPLAIGAVLFERDELRQAALLTEEAIWLFGAKAVSAFAERSEGPKLHTSSFPTGGIYVMASADRCPQRMVIDAGPLGAGRAGHGHADALAATLALDGHTWLVDSGTFCYTEPDSERDSFRGTGAHNTVRVDGLDQAEPSGPFAWSSPPNVRAERWLPGLTFSLFEGSHDSYSRLPDPVVHRRLVFHLHGVFWLIHDAVAGREEHGVESNWHFASHLEVCETGGAFIASRLPSSPPASDLRLALLPSQGSGWTCELGTTEISAVYGTKQSAPILRVSARVRLPSKLAMLMVPLLRVSDRAGKFSMLTGQCGTEHGSVCGYRYDESAGSHYLMISDGCGDWTAGPWASDARFIYCNVQDGGIAHFIFCDGSFAHLRGKSVIDHPRRVERFECLNQASNMRIDTSDNEAGRSFSRDVFQSCETVF